VVAIFAGVRGYLDAIAVEQIGRFESTYLADMRSKHADLLATIRKDGEISAATEASLKGILDNFAKSFV
jgi:F-type H+/Na+-transporting ATPase subunit alpha